MDINKGCALSFMPLALVTCRQASVKFQKLAQAYQAGGEPPCRKSLRISSTCGPLHLGAVSAQTHADPSISHVL